MTFVSNISPEPIFQMTIGFWASKTLMAAVELEIFTKISSSDKKTVTLNQLQEMIGLEKRPTEVLVAALVAMGLLNATEINDKENNKVANIDKQQQQQQQQFYSNSPLSDTFLDKTKPTYIGDFIMIMDKQFYLKWDSILQSLQTNKPFDKNSAKKDLEALSTKDIFETAASNHIAGQQLEKFTHAMYGVSVAPAMSLAKTFDFSKYKKMMDIGGGSGVYAIQVVKENPNMKAMVLDLEPACNIANQYIKRFGLEDKIQTKVFDFFKDEFPKECDIAFLSHIIHQYSKEANIALLKRIYNNLPNENSAIIISEWFLNNDKTGPLHSALLGMTMILEHKDGRNYSYSEVSEMLSNAGFKDMQQKSLSGPADIIIGYKNDNN